MKTIEIKLSEKFKEYVISNIDKKIKAKEVIKELLNNDNIHKCKPLQLDELSISDLKYEDSKIKRIYIDTFKNVFVVSY